MAKAGIRVSKAHRKKTASDKRGGAMVEGSEAVRFKNGPTGYVDPSSAETTARRRPAPPRWYLIYFVLAAFDIVTLTGSLMFHHRIIRIHQDTMAFDREWSDEFQRHIELTTLIGAANAPGNDVFLTLDADAELMRMNRVLPHLADKIEEIRLSLLAGPSRDTAAPLLSHLDKIERKCREMAGDAKRLFAHVKVGDMESAGATMAAMDQKYAAITELLNRLEHDSHATVRSNLEQQTLLAEDMRSFEFLIGAIIGVMIVGVAIYGYKLSDQMGTYARSLETQYKALKASERRFRDLAESSIQGIAVHRDDRPLFVNRAWVTIHGFESAQDAYAGQRMSDTVAPGELARLSEKRRQFLDRGEILHTEYRAHRLDGATVWLECTERTIDWEGTPAILSVVVDVTGRKYAEDELASARSKIEVSEMQRTRFFATVGHDLRQPLHTISLLLSILQAEQPAARNEEIIEVLTSACDIMTNLLDEVLDLARLEAGGSEPSIKPVSIGPLFRHLETEFLPQARNAGIELRAVHSEIAISTDPVLFERILRNLLSNAIRNTPKGRVLLGVRRRSGTARVEVWDTGRGISEADTKNIFREFYRTAETVETHNTNLGLGLSIVRRLTEILGHRIEIRSKLGTGTVFSVEAPVTEPARMRLPAISKSGEIIDSESLEGLRVLIVDDDEQILRAMRIAFAGWKCRPLLARSGSEALEQLRQIGEPPDMILADLWLRQSETGLEVIHAVWRLFERRVPSILISADRESAHIRDAARDGFTVLHKPLRLPELYEAVKTAARTVIRVEC